MQAALGVETEIMELLANSRPLLAPYGLSTSVSPDYLNSYSPFKPVIHGQACHTKFAIIDKFGQPVTGLQLDPFGSGALYPCVARSLACGLLPAPQGANEDVQSEYWPDTAVQAEDENNGAGMCQFFQVPPRINRRSRLNLTFLKPLSDEESAKEGRIDRRSAGEWDNSIWAWLLPNFQNHSVQVYTPDGDFVMEYLLDHETKTTIPSTGPSNAGDLPKPKGQLPYLLKSMHEYEFCKNLFNMLAGAVDAVNISAADFDSALPSVLGRPFCVADIGVSIELSAPPLKDTSLLSTEPTELELLDYKFQVALGNSTAGYDGLVGTFTAKGDIRKISTAFSRDESPLSSKSAGVATVLRPVSEHPQPLTL